MGKKMFCYEDFEINGYTIVVKCKKGVSFRKVYNYIESISNNTEYYKGEIYDFKRKKGMIILDLTLIEFK